MVKANGVAEATLCYTGDVLDPTRTKVSVRVQQECGGDQQADAVWRGDAVLHRGHKIGPDADQGVCVWWWGGSERVGEGEGASRQAGRHNEPTGNSNSIQ